MVGISDLLALPALLLFHVTWLLHSLRRPLLLVSALCILSNPAAAVRKCRLFGLTFLYLARSQDKKFKVPKEKDPASFFPADLGGNGDNKGASYREKTVILIRHGESTWNDTFNSGDRNKLLFILFYVPNMIKALANELYFFVAGKDSESWFFDAALSSKGVGQAEDLRRHLKKEKMRLGSLGNPAEERAVKLLLAVGEESKPSSIVVSSNLRRAISTAAIGLADRFAVTSEDVGDDDILLLPCLQEISFNPDALSILPPQGVAHPTWCDRDIPGFAPGKFEQLVDTKFHLGNKAVDSNGLIRLNQFVTDLFDNSKLPYDNIIATGHSLFFRSFMQVFLPRGTEHISKKKKLVNGGTVAVTVREATLGNGRKEYMIDPRSITVVYGGFGKHKKG